MFLKGFGDLNERHEDDCDTEKLQAHLVKERSELRKNKAFLVARDELEKANQLINLCR